MHIIKAMIIAFSTYSKIPMPQFEWKEEDMRYSMCFFPWVGAVIGALVFAWYRIAQKLGFHEWTYVCIATAIPLLVTGGFHVDGYMDTMDAFHSYQPRERKLEILKDAHIGAFSVIMLAVFGLIYMGAFGQIEGAENLGVFCCGFFLSRCLSGLGVVSLRSAKSDGLLYHFASTAHERWVKGALYLQIILCVILMIWIQIKTAFFVLVAAGLTYLYYWWRSYRELNGITGDTAGYFLTLCEGAMVVATVIANVSSFL